MSQKSSFSIKIIELILLGWMIGACSPSATSFPAVSTIKGTLEPTLAVSLSVTATVLPIVTPTIFATSSDQPAPTPGDNQYGTIILVDRGEESKILFFGSNGQSPKTYPFANQTYAPWQVEQVSANCDLITLVKTDNGQKLISIAQNGEIKQEIFFLENNRPNVPKFLPLLSQTGKYVAYVVFSGELYYDTAQHQDVEVVALDNINHPTRLTLHGGAWKDGGTWSLDGTQIAYTDYDEKGILQVYITELAGEMTKKKITQFTRPNEKAAGPLGWSPDGNQLALIVEDDKHNTDVWIVSTQSDPAFKLKLPDGKISIAGSGFWSEDSSRLLLYIGNYSDIDGLYWFDVKNNKLLDTLTSKKASQIDPEADSFAYIFPLTMDLSKVIFYNSRGQWYLYDVAQQKINNVSWLSNRSWGSHIEVSLFQKISVCEH